jgi:hypothetical protein
VALIDAARSLCHARAALAEHLRRAQDNFGCSESRAFCRRITAQFRRQLARAGSFCSVATRLSVKDIDDAPVGDRWNRQASVGQGVRLSFANESREAEQVTPSPHIKDRSQCGARSAIRHSTNREISHTKLKFTVTFDVR